MSDRDALAKIVYDNHGFAGASADAIIAAGWRPPLGDDYQIAWLTFRDPDGSMCYTTVASGHGDGEWIVNGEVATGYSEVQVIR